MSSPLIRLYSLSTLSIWTNVFWAIPWSLSASALIHLLFLLPSCSSHLTLSHSSTVISGVSECQRRTNSRMRSNRHWVMNWVWSITIRSYPNPFPLLPFIPLFLLSSYSASVHSHMLSFSLSHQSFILKGGISTNFVVQWQLWQRNKWPEECNGCFLSLLILSITEALLVDLQNTTEILRRSHLGRNSESREDIEPIYVDQKKRSVSLIADLWSFCLDCQCNHVWNH